MSNVLWVRHHLAVCASAVPGRRVLYMDELSFDGLTGEVVTPCDPRYNELRQEWNRAVQKFPAAIVYCSTKYDVSNAVLWARKNRFAFRIRGGGHNYEGYSTADAALVIDISRLDSLKLDEKNRVLKVGGGVKLEKLYAFVGSKGYPFPGGTCPTVGAAGFALGGGWGLSCRHLGLGCDSLLEVELVNYEGGIVVANSKENSELFWACRGAGGGNFGVVVSLVFRLPEKTGKVTLVELYYPDTPREKQELFLGAWQSWLYNVSEKLTLVASVYNSQEEGFAVFCRGIYYGPPEEAREQLRPLTELGGAEVSLFYLSFLEAVTKIEESYPESEKFKSTGRFVQRDYGPGEISNLVGLIRERPEGSVFAGLTLYTLGGRVAGVSRHDTAFFYRRARYILSIQSIWLDDRFARDNVDWVARKFRYLETVTEGSFVNFPYGGLVDYLEEYYGANAERLRAVKKQYDPYNIFRFPQSIRQIKR